nr:acyltransferase [Polynucleobacter sp. QLW-P1DATA-2]
MPGYFLVLALGGLLLEPEIFDYKNLWILASTALFDYDGALPLNPVGALWSIATEMQFYVICPIVALLIATLNFKKYSLAKNFIFLVLLFGIMMVYRLINFIDGGYYWKTAVMTPVVGNLDLFFGGMILSYILTRDRKNIFSVFIGLILSFMFYIFGAYVVSSIFIGKNWLWKIGYFGPTLTGLSVLLIITIFETNISEKLKNYLIIFIKKSSFFGLITYEIYLLHDPIQRLTRGLFPGELTLENSLLALLVSTLIIIPCAYVLNIFFETSFSKFRYKRNH